MLKAIRILGSSSSSRLVKPYANFPLISGKPIEAAVSKSSRTQSFASQFRVFHISHAHPESTPDEGSPPSSSTFTAIQSTGLTKKIKFCQSCGGPTKYEIPDGEEKMRAICTTCEKITYENPKMVVGCLVEHESKILLCKRNIQPSYGLWTLPSGFMEIGESASEGAIRETWEEANAEVEVVSPLTLLNLPLIAQYLEDKKIGRPKFHYGIINKRPV